MHYIIRGFSTGAICVRRNASLPLNPGRGIRGETTGRISDLAVVHVTACSENPGAAFPRFILRKIVGGRGKIRVQYRQWVVRNLPLIPRPPSRNTQYVSPTSQDFGLGSGERKHPIINSPKTSGTCGTKGSLTTSYNFTFINMPFIAHQYPTFKPRYQRNNVPIWDREEYLILTFTNAGVWDCKVEIKTPCREMAVGLTVSWQ